MKLIFLDTNIFLSFYSFTNEDLEQLRKLIDLINSEEIKLYLTDQVFNEFRKNREGKIAEAYKQFDNSNISLKMPLICKEYPEYGKITKLQRFIDKLKSELKEKILLAVSKSRLKADVVIENLFKVATRVDSDKYLEKATERRYFGLPPGEKSKSYGDEINWEALLENVATDGDFILISDDGSYASEMNEEKIHPYLEKEWKKKKRTDIYFYKTLSRFFGDHDINIQLKEEEEKNRLIESLINSGDFFTTHELIRRLGKFNSFTNDQIKGLSTALLGNSQVNWIIKDEDVKSFYSKNLADKADIFELETWSQISKMIFGEDSIDTDKEIENILETAELSETGQESQKNEDIPF